MNKFKQKSVAKLSELYQEHKEALGNNGFMGLMWKSISPSVPLLLTSLDDDPEMLEKIRLLLRGIMEALEEDTTNA